MYHKAFDSTSLSPDFAVSRLLGAQYPDQQTPIVGLRIARSDLYIVSAKPATMRGKPHLDATVFEFGTTLKLDLQWPFIRDL